MTSVRHWLNLEGPDPLSAASAAQVPLPCYPIPSTPSLTPSGASYWCFSLGPCGEQVLGSSRAWKQVIPGPVSSPGQGRHALMLATLYPLRGLRCLLVLCPKSHRGEGKLGG